MDAPMNPIQGEDISHWRYRLELRCGPPDRSTRTQRLAWALRRCADRLDGGCSLRLTYHTTPRLSHDVLLQCLRGGLNNVVALVKSELQRMTEERVLRREFPELYAESSPDRHLS